MTSFIVFLLVLALIAFVLAWDIDIRRLPNVKRQSLEFGLRRLRLSCILAGFGLLLFVVLVLVV
ncbi:MAG: hypothetical protein JWN38_1137 [Candidatus Saccharibacteria bacterium]|nr:hypothetical protein [Candidatus Saccharibacteria bacterium]